MFVTTKLQYRSFKIGGGESSIQKLQVGLLYNKTVKLYVLSHRGHVNSMGERERDSRTAVNISVVERDQSCSWGKRCAA